jgi:hypothetical protein
VGWRRSVSGSNDSERDCEGCQCLVDDVQEWYYSVAKRCHLKKAKGFALPPQEGMMINADTNAALNSSEATIGDVKRILSALKYSDDEWSTTVVGLIDQGIEHHAAFLLLIRSNLVGSAFALVGKGD